MPSRFWTHNTTLVAGQTARASQVNAQLDGVDAGFESVQTEMNRGFRFTDGTPDETDFELSETPAERAGQVLGFDSSGNATLKNVTFRWRSDWATTTVYAINDIVAGPTANSGSLYLCLQSHTAGTFATDLAAARWSLLIDLTEVKQSLITHQFITHADSPFQAKAGDDLMIDVSGGAVTVTLPASPLITDQPINLLHVDGSLTTNPITVARNGEKIMGEAEDMTVDTVNASFGLAYCNASLGWRLRLV